MAFKLLYNEDALTDLKVVFARSREHHPGKTEQFGNDVFNPLDLLTAFSYLGAPIYNEPNVRRLLHPLLYAYYQIDEAREAIEILHFWHSSRRRRQFCQLPPQIIVRAHGKTLGHRV